jgi:hypothetical protein
VTKTLDNKNAEIAICDMAIQSQSLSQDHMWTVDPNPYRSFANREFKRKRNKCNKNPGFAICDIAIQSQPLNRE